MAKENLDPHPWEHIDLARKSRRFISPGFELLGAQLPFFLPPQGFPLCAMLDPEGTELGNKKKVMEVSPPALSSCTLWK